METSRERPERAAEGPRGLCCRGYATVALAVLSVDSVVSLRVVVAVLATSVVSVVAVSVVTVLHPAGCVHLAVWVCFLPTGLK